MHKITCDICGTTYPETDECCPICGSSREFAVENEEIPIGPMPEYIPHSRMESFLEEALHEPLFPAEPRAEEPAPKKGGRFSREQPAKPARGHNTLAVILLTVVITIFVFGSCYLLFRYYLPDRLGHFEEETTQEPTQTEDSTPEITTQPSVPCKSIILTGGVPEITRLGQYWLLNVIVMPENTTDTIYYISSDESVVTVTEGGRLCAVGEGETTVVITCGDEQILCPVKVRLSEEAATPGGSSEPAE